MERYGVRDGPWERIKDLRPGREETVGVTARDKRLLEEAVLDRSTGPCKVVAHTRSNRCTPRPYDRHLYKARALVENFFGKLKSFHTIAPPATAEPPAFPGRHRHRAQLRTRPIKSKNPQTSSLGIPQESRCFLF